MKELFPVRILQVFSSLDRGGAETMIMNVYRTINREKVQFDFIVHTKQKGDYHDEIKSLGGLIFIAPRYRLINHFQYFKFYRNFFKYHKEYKIIHGHYFTTSSLYFFIAKKHRLVCIAHAHSAVINTGIKTILQRIIMIPNRWLATYKFACSPEAGKKVFGRKAKFTLINNAIRTEIFIYNFGIAQKMKSELGILGKFAIGHIGNFTSPKNYSLIIEIFKAIQRAWENSVLILVGNNNNNPKIQEKIFELGLKEKVIFTGVRSDIPDILMAVDAFLFPSLYEGLPVTVIEAQASGLKCFLSDAITKEVKITNLVEFVSLKEKPESWAEQILKFRNGYERKDMSHHIKLAGYDVTSNTVWLEHFYITAAMSQIG